MIPTGRPVLLSLQAAWQYTLTPFRGVTNHLVVFIPDIWSRVVGYSQGIHESSACLTNPSRYVATFVLPVRFRPGRWRTSGIAGKAGTVADLSDNFVGRNWVTRNAVVSTIGVTY